MSYLKLCQIQHQSETEIYYQEDCMGQVLVSSSLSYPVTFVCEVINFESPSEFSKRGKASFANIVEVVVSTSPDNIRNEVFSKLALDYPELVI